MADEWLTLEQAAAYLKISKPSIYRYTGEGRLRFVRRRVGHGELCRSSPTDPSRS